MCLNCSFGMQHLMKFIYKEGRIVFRRKRMNLKNIWNVGEEMDCTAGLVNQSINQSWQPQPSSTPGISFLLVGHAESQLCLVVSSQIPLQSINERRTWTPPSSASVLRLPKNKFSSESKCKNCILFVALKNVFLLY